jgi:hypothetical protein
MSDRREPMIDLRIRISRKLVFWLVLSCVLLFVIAPLLWLALQTLGGPSSGHSSA